LAAAAVICFDDGGPEVVGAMRSKLFVPGSRPEFFEKAWLSQADALSFDLEDAVVPEAKDAARRAIAAALEQAPADQAKTVIVRVNAPGSADFEADLDAVVRPGLDAINLPKVDTPETVVALARRLDELEARLQLKRRIGVLVNIETPEGLRRALEIARASDRVIGLQLGFGDLFSSAGIERSLAAMTPVWLAVRFAAAEAGVPAYDAAYVRIADIDGYRAEAETSRRFGYAGKSCVHPTQIPVANTVYFPTDKEIATARRVAAEADAARARGVGAFTVDGVMYDGPLVVRAREIVRVAEARHG
jgi:citrate lyase subunit beta / citryl-CoA lyase